MPYLLTGPKTCEESHYPQTQTTQNKINFYTLASNNNNNKRPRYNQVKCCNGWSIT